MWCTRLERALVHLKHLKWVLNSMTVDWQDRPGYLILKPGRLVVVGGFFLTKSSVGNNNDQASFSQVEQIRALSVDNANKGVRKCAHILHACMRAMKLV